jgi:hypothetical protein
VGAICQRASDALAGPHLQLQDWVLDQAAVHVDETGWRTGGKGRALWAATTPEATFLQISQHCNREQFTALVGSAYPGIVVSDRWNGYSHLTPTAARCAGRTWRATSDATPTGGACRNPSANTVVACAGSTCVVSIDCPALRSSRMDDAVRGASGSIWPVNDLVAGYQDLTPASDDFDAFVAPGAAA